MSRSHWCFGLLYLVALALTSLGGHWARREAAPVCHFSGTVIDPLYRVRIVDEQGRSYRFCGIGCAERWLQRHSSVCGRVQVVDEVSGAEVEAAAAHFVRSLVVTSGATGNRIHAFRQRRDAERAAQSPGAELLEGRARPFSLQKGDCCADGCSCR